MTSVSSAVSLRPATAPRAPLAERLLHVDPSARSFADHSFSELPSLLRPGDLVVVNDAATLPASLRLQNLDAEIRLLSRETDGTFRAVAFGAGDFRTKTEDRPPPPAFPTGSVLSFGATLRSPQRGTLRASVVGVEPSEPRLVRLRFDRVGRELYQALYDVGRVVQYSYHERPLELWDVQNRYASRPWAFEPPSAGRPLTFGVLGELRARGVQLAVVTHAAGLSSTGSSSLDRRLPVPELSDIPLETVHAVEATRARGGRVVAVGTTVVRALEGRALESPRLSAGRNETSLVIGPGFRPRVVTGLLTGLHEPASSHFALLQAFAERPLLLRALEHASREGYFEHEFGDSCLVLSGPSAAV